MEPLRQNMINIKCTRAVHYNDNKNTFIYNTPASLKMITFINESQIIHVPAWKNHTF